MLQTVELADQLGARGDGWCELLRVGHAWVVFRRRNVRGLLEVRRRSCSPASRKKTQESLLYSLSYRPAATSFESDFVSMGPTAKGLDSGVPCNHFCF